LSAEAKKDETGEEAGNGNPNLVAAYVCFEREKGGEVPVTAGGRPVEAGDTA